MRSLFSLRSFSRLARLFPTGGAVCAVVLAAAAGPEKPLQAGPSVPATTEQLPVDRFDEYQLGALPPSPWRLLGAIPAGVTLALQSEGESALVGNKVTGKGLVMRDASPSDGGGLGLATAFAPTPAGAVYLGFDFLLEKGGEAAGDLELGAELTDAQGRGLQLHLSGAQGLRLRQADGAWRTVAPLTPGRWFHLGVTLTAKQEASLVLLTEDDLQQLDKPPVATVSLPPADGYTDLRFFNAGGPGQQGGWRLDNVTVAGRVEAGRGEWLPFEPLPVETLRQQRRKVFAYYYPPYNSGWSSADTGLSGYVRTTLNPSEKVDPRRAKAGTKLFYHPLPRPPMPAGLSKEEELIVAMEEEVRLAIQMGVDGFLLDFMSYPKASDAYYNQRAFALLEAARRVDPQFKILPAVYSNSGSQGIRGEGDAGRDPLEYANSPVFKRLDSAPAVLRTEEGRMVLSMWLPERHSAEWWRKAFAEMDRLGLAPVFLPTFNSTGRLAEFTPLTVGMAHWGPRTPQRNEWVRSARKHTPLVVAPIASHDIRSRGCIFWESRNLDTLRSTWAAAIEDGADWTFIDTWSDYSEQAMAPSTAIGFALYDLNRYYGQWFKTGRAPEITRDVLYYSYRRHHTEVDPGRGVRWKRVADAEGLKSGSNEIEVLGFLTEPGELSIRIDDQVYTQKAGAGITSFKVPLPPGKAFTPQFSLVRNGVAVVAGAGRYAVLDKVEYPNLLYHSGVLVGVQKGGIQP